MADTPKNASAPAPAYADATMYAVTLSRVVEWPVGSGMMHSPRSNPHEMLGSVCQEIADGIATAVPV